MAKHSDLEQVRQARRLHDDVLPRLGRLPKVLDRKLFGGDVGKLEAAVARVQRIGAERAAAVIEKNDRRRVVRMFMKRVRDGVRAVYGDDSLEYEMVGGTRASQRKRPVRKARAA